MSRKHNIRHLALSGLFASLLAAGAFIKISLPLQPFPMHFTLQLLFALLAGFLLGPKWGAASVLVYLFLGLLGMPVFAAGGGPSYLLRPTFGFLLGFVFAAFFTGILAKKQRFPSFLMAALLGMLAYYLCGMLYFYVISNYVIHMPVTWSLVWINCFAVTVIPDTILCAASALLALRLRPVLNRLS